MLAGEPDDPATFYAGFSAYRLSFVFSAQPEHSVGESLSADAAEDERHSRKHEYPAEITMRMNKSSGNRQSRSQQHTESAIRTADVQYHWHPPPQCLCS